MLMNRHTIQSQRMEKPRMEIVPAVAYDELKISSFHASISKSANFFRHCFLLLLELFVTNTTCFPCKELLEIERFAQECHSAHHLTKRLDALFRAIDNGVTTPDDTIAVKENRVKL